jgi:hypothetical protein
MISSHGALTKVNLVKKKWTVFYPIGISFAVEALDWAYGRATYSSRIIGDQPYLEGLVAAKAYK